MESFKKRLAKELLHLLLNELTEDQREWIKIQQQQKSSPDTDDPKILEIQNTIKGLYSKEELHAKSRPLFKKILEDYVKFMSEDLDERKTTQLKKIVARF